MKCLPIDGHNNRVKREASGVCGVLAPYGSAWKVVIFRSVKVVIETGNYNKKPGNNGQDFVNQDRSCIVGVLLGEGVD